MRFVFVFAAIYILIAAVACQPLREAKAELELSKRFNRKPPDRFKKARPATSKVKREFQAFESVAEAASDVFSRFGARFRSRKDAVQATEEAVSFTQPKTKPYPRPNTEPDATEPFLKHPQQRYEFHGNEGGYTGDVDRDNQRARPYDRPPLTFKRENDVADTSKADASVQDESKEKPKYKHMWQDPNQRPWMVAAASVSAGAIWLVAKNIKQDLETTQSLNAAVASSQAQQFAASQQALSENAALEADGPSYAPREAGGEAGLGVGTGQPRVVKRAISLRVIREGLSRERIANAYRNRIQDFRDLPSDVKGFLTAGIAVVSAALAVAGTMIYFYVKKFRNARSDPKPSPQGVTVTVPATPPSPPSPPHAKAEPVIHTSLNKRSVLPQIDTSRQHRPYAEAVTKQAADVHEDIDLWKKIKHRSEQTHSDRLVRRSPRASGFEDFSRDGFNVRIRDAVASVVLLGVIVGTATWGVLQILEANRHHDSRKHKRDVSASSKAHELRRRGLELPNFEDLLAGSSRVAGSGRELSRVENDGDEYPIEQAFEAVVGVLLLGGITIGLGLLYVHNEKLKHDRRMHDKQDGPPPSNPHLRRRADTERELQEAERDFHHHPPSSAKMGERLTKRMVPADDTDTRSAALQRRANRELVKRELDPRSAVGAAAFIAFLIIGAKYYGQTKESRNGREKHKPDASAPSPSPKTKRRLHDDFAVKEGTVDDTASAGLQRRAVAGKRLGRGAEQVVAYAIGGLLVYGLFSKVRAAIKDRQDPEIKRAWYPPGAQPLIAEPPSRRMGQRITKRMVTADRALEMSSMASPGPNEHDTASFLPVDHAGSAAAAPAVASAPAARAHATRHAVEAGIQRERLHEMAAEVRHALSQITVHRARITLFALPIIIAGLVAWLVYDVVKHPDGRDDDEDKNKSHANPPSPRRKLGERLAKRMVRADRAVEMGNMADRDLAPLSPELDPVESYASDWEDRLAWPLIISVAATAGTCIALMVTGGREIWKELHEKDDDDEVDDKPKSQPPWPPHKLAKSEPIFRRGLLQDDAEARRASSKHLTKRMFQAPVVEEDPRVSSTVVPFDGNERAVVDPALAEALPAGEGRLMNPFVVIPTAAALTGICSGAVIAVIEYFKKQHRRADKSPPASATPPHKLAKRALLQRRDLITGSASSGKHLSKRSELQSVGEEVGEALAAEAPRVSSTVAHHKDGAPSLIEDNARITQTSAAKKTSAFVQAGQRFKSGAARVGDHLSRGRNLEMWLVGPPFLAWVIYASVELTKEKIRLNKEEKHLPKEEPVWAVEPNLRKRGFSASEAQAVIKKTQDLARKSGRGLGAAGERVSEHLDDNADAYTLLAGILVIGGLAGLAIWANHHGPLQDHHPRPHLSKRGLSPSDVKVVAEETDALAQKDGERPDIAMQRARRFIILHKQGELYAVLIAVLASTVAGASWVIVDHIKHQKQKERQASHASVLQAEQAVYGNTLSKRALTLADLGNVSDEAMTAIRTVIRRWRRAIIRRRYRGRPPLPVHRLGGERQAPRVPWRAIGVEAAPYLAIAAGGGLLSWQLAPLIKELVKRQRQRRLERENRALHKYLGEHEDASRTQHSNNLSKRAWPVDALRNAPEGAMQAVRMVVRRFRRDPYERLGRHRPAMPEVRLGARPAAQPRWRAIAPKPAALVAGAVIGTAFYLSLRLAAEKARREQEREDRAQLKYRQEHEAAERTFNSQHRLSKRGKGLLMQLAELTEQSAADLKSLVRKTPMTDEKRQARNGRLRKLGGIVLVGATVEALKNLLLYEGIKMHVHNKERQRFDDELRREQQAQQQQQQQQQSIYGASYPQEGSTVASASAPGYMASTTWSKPSVQLRKRAKVKPADLQQMDRTVESAPPGYGRRVLASKIREKTGELSSALGEAMHKYRWPIGGALAAALVVDTAYLVWKLEGSPVPHWLQPKAPASSSNGNLHRRHLDVVDEPLYPDLRKRGVGAVAPLEEHAVRASVVSAPPYQGLRELGKELGRKVEDRAHTIGKKVAPIATSVLAVAAFVGVMYGVRKLAEHLAKKYPDQFRPHYPASNSNGHLGKRQLHRRELMTSETFLQRSALLYKRGGAESVAEAAEAEEAGETVAHVQSAEEAREARARELQSYVEAQRRKAHQRDKRFYGALAAVMVPYLTAVTVCSFTDCMNLHPEGSRAPASNSNAELHKRKLTPDAHLTPLQKRDKGVEQEQGPELATEVTQEVAPTGFRFTEPFVPTRPDRWRAPPLRGPPTAMEGAKGVAIVAGVYVGLLTFLGSIAGLAIYFGEKGSQKGSEEHRRSHPEHGNLHKHELASKTFEGHLAPLQKRYNIGQVPEMAEEARVAFDRLRRAEARRLARIAAQEQTPREMTMKEKIRAVAILAGLGTGLVTIFGGIAGLVVWLGIQAGQAEDDKEPERDHRLRGQSSPLHKRWYAAESANQNPPDVGSWTQDQRQAQPSARERDTVFDKVAGAADGCALIATVALPMIRVAISPPWKNGPRDTGPRKRSLAASLHKRVEPAAVAEAASEAVTVTEAEVEAVQRNLAAWADIEAIRPKLRESTGGIADSRNTNLEFVAPRRVENGRRKQYAKVFAYVLAPVATVAAAVMSVAYYKERKRTKALEAKDAQEEQAGRWRLGKREVSASIQKRGFVPQLSTKLGVDAATLRARLKPIAAEERKFRYKMTALGVALVAAVAAVATPLTYFGIRKSNDARRQRNQEAAQHLRKRALLEKRMVEPLPTAAVMLRTLQQVAFKSRGAGAFDLFGLGPPQHVTGPHHLHVQQRPHRRPADTSASPADLARIAEDVVRGPRHEQAQPTLQKRMVQALFKSDEAHVDSASAGDLVRIARQVVAGPRTHDGDQRLLRKRELHKRIVVDAGLYEPSKLVMLRVIRQVAIGSHRSDILAVFDDDDHDDEDDVEAPLPRQPVHRHPSHPLTSASPADLARIARNVVFARGRNGDDGRNQ